MDLRVPSGNGSRSEKHTVYIVQVKGKIEVVLVLQFILSIKVTNSWKEETRLKIANVKLHPEYSTQAWCLMINADSYLKVQKDN